MSCDIFGIRANIDRSKACRSQSKTRKNHPKKKKSLTIVFSPPESCLCHFSTWSKKVVIQLCFPLPKKKETHARPITHQPPKPIKSTPTTAEPNNHQPPQSPTPHLTHQPPKPNTLPSTTAMPKPEMNSRHSSMPRAGAVAPRLRTTTRRRSPTPAKDPR